MAYEFFSDTGPGITYETQHLCDRKWCTPISITDEGPIQFRSVEDAYKDIVEQASGEWRVI